MAEIKTLDSIITVNNEEYAVIAEEAKKVTHTLKITAGNESITFDGSADKAINVAAGGGGDADSAENAKKIQVHLDNNRKEYATITISKNDPNAAEGTVGNIWFKYN